eukprot:COSAG01_NODE_383_length_17798_cov_351.422058_3_plen_286_part_00
MVAVSAHAKVSSQRWLRPLSSVLASQLARPCTLSGPLTCTSRRLALWSARNRPLPSCHPEIFRGRAVCIRLRCAAFRPSSHRGAGAYTLRRRGPPRRRRRPPPSPTLCRRNRGPGGRPRPPRHPLQMGTRPCERYGGSRAYVTGKQRRRRLTGAPAKRGQSRVRGAVIERPHTARQVCCQQQHGREDHIAHRHVSAARGEAAHRPQCPVHPAGRCSAAVPGTTACRTGEGAAAERGTSLALAGGGWASGQWSPGGLAPSKTQTVPEKLIRKPRLVLGLMPPDLNR